MKPNPKRPWRDRDCAMQTMHHWVPENSARQKKEKRKPLPLSRVLGWAACALAVAFVVGAMI